MKTRKTLKILHTLASCGLIGGLLAYMVLLAAAPQPTPAAYADLRVSIAAISNYVLLPSLALALVSGLWSMAVHAPFRDKRWAWLKAALGILMFKGVLTILGAKADYAATVAERIAAGAATPGVLEAALAYEWHTLLTVMALSVANVVLGVWRPALKSGQPAATAAGVSSEATPHTPASPPAAASANRARRALPRA